MGNREEVSYNPQLGYLKTVFEGDFDFLTGVKSYEANGSGILFTVGTYQGNTARAVISRVGDISARFRMYPPGCEKAFDNSIYDLAEKEWTKVSENDAYRSGSGSIPGRSAIIWMGS